MIENNDFETAMHEFISSVTKVRQTLRSRVMTLLEKSNYDDITLEMSQFLYCLNSYDGSANQQQLADALYRNKSSITSLISNLIKRNLIVRKTDPMDRRNNIITFTKRGSEFINKLYPELYRTFNIQKAGLEITDIQVLTQKINKIIEA